jgi:hypothetical protein
MMTSKYIHRIDTPDGPIEYEDESPPTRELTMRLLRQQIP